MYLLFVISLWVDRRGTWRKGDGDHNPPPHVLATLACLRRAVCGTAEIGQEDPGNQGNDKLAHVPPSGERSEEPLVTGAVSIQHTARGREKNTPRRQKLQENQRIHRDIPPGSSSNNSPKRAEGDEIHRPGTRAEEDTSDQQSAVKRRLPADEVGGDAPERRAEDEADIVGHGAVADLDDVFELGFDGRLDAADTLGGKLLFEENKAEQKVNTIHPVSCWVSAYVVNDVSESGDDEEFPLVSKAPLAECSQGR